MLISKLESRYSITRIVNWNASVETWDEKHPILGGFSRLLEWIRPFSLKYRFYTLFLTLKFVYKLVLTKYLLFFSRRLLPERQTITSITSRGDRRLREYVTELAIREDGELVGQKFGESALAEARNLRIIQIIRGEEILWPPFTEVVLEEGDSLVVAGRIPDLIQIQTEEGLANLDEILASDRIDLSSKETELAEILVLPNSSYIGKTLEAAQLRHHFRVNVVAIQRLSDELTNSGFSLIPTFVGELKPDHYRSQTSLKNFQELPADSRAPLFAYLEGRVLQSEGKLEEAARHFEAALEVDPEPVEPRLRLADVLAASGQIDSAELLLRNALPSDPEIDTRIWKRWVALNFTEAVCPLEILHGRTAAEHAYGRDLRWLLERLIQGAPVRINCGGKEFVSKDGTVWGEDRFFVGGRPQSTWLSGVLADTPDYELYKARRHFRYSEAGGYEIPLPVGKYKVTLHFVERQCLL